MGKFCKMLPDSHSEITQLRLHISTIIGYVEKISSNFIMIEINFKSAVSFGFKSMRITNHYQAQIKLKQFETTMHALQRKHRNTAI